MVEKTLWTIEERLKRNPDSYSLLLERLSTCSIKWTKFNELKLCKALSISLDKLLINSHEQRGLSCRRVFRRIESFEEMEAMPLKVYECLEKPGYYVIYDGQHTASALYILITKIFKENIEDCTIPIIKYDAAQVKEHIALSRSTI